MDKQVLALNRKEIGVIVHREKTEEGMRPNNDNKPNNQPTMVMVVVMVMVNGDGSLTSLINNSTNNSFFLALPSTQRGRTCTGRIIRSNIQHVHNCNNMGGKCCSANQDGTGVTWTGNALTRGTEYCGTSAYSLGYCWSSKPH